MEAAGSAGAQVAVTSAGVRGPGSAGPPRIVLLGPSGGGRTTVGRALAELVGADLVECEDLVAARAGSSFGDAVLRLSSADFVALVEEAALDLLAPSDRLAPGVAGSIATLLPSSLESAAVRSALEDLSTAGTPVVYLSAPIGELARRTGLNAPRSPALGMPRATFTAFMKRHRELSAPCVTAEYDTSGASADQVAEQLAGQFALQ